MIVYETNIEVPSYCGVQGRHNRTITTYIEKIEKKSLFGKIKTDYIITQIIPLIGDPFYDGEYSTNRNLKSQALQQHELAELWIKKHR